MATAENNLSEYNHNSIPDAANMRIAIVVSEWNIDITQGLLNGTKDTLLKHGLKLDNLIVKWVPGAYELALGAQFLLEKDKTDAVVCLGSVIRGETAHFDFVCQASSQGIKDVSLKYNSPVIFGVLTDDNKQQGLDRSGGKHGNKGIEAAIAAIKMLALSNSI